MQVSIVLSAMASFALGVGATSLVASLDSVHQTALRRKLEERALRRNSVSLLMSTRNYFSSRVEAAEFAVALRKRGSDLLLITTTTQVWCGGFCVSSVTSVYSEREAQRYWSKLQRMFPTRPESVYWVCGLLQGDHRRSVARELLARRVAGEVVVDNYERWGQ